MTVVQPRTRAPEDSVVQYRGTTHNRYAGEAEQLGRDVTKLLSSQRGISQRNRVYRIQITDREVHDIKVFGQAVDFRVIRYRWERAVLNSEDEPYPIKNEGQPDSGEEPERWALNLGELPFGLVKHAGINFPKVGFNMLADMWKLQVNSEKPLAVFNIPMPECFPVRLTLAEGQEWDETTKQATLKYTLTDQWGVVINDSDVTPMAPVKLRPSCRMIPPPDGYDGMARWNIKRTKIELYDAGEVPAVFNCETGG